MAKLCRMLVSVLLAGTALPLSVNGVSYPNPGTVTGDTGAHDPSILKTPDGKYLVATTGLNILLKTSTDRIAFRDAGAAFPSGAPWTLSYTDPKNPTNLWAPDISLHNGVYYMYYSASSFGSQRSGIFLATSKTGTSGTWMDQGLVIESSRSNNFNAIDPNLFVDTDGKWWLAFGSYWTGIKMIALNPGTGKRADSNVLSLARRTPGGSEDAIEAPFLFRRGKYYYLYVSWDHCCQGRNSTYRIMVGRSTSVTGPFVDRSGKQMMEGGATEVLASHGNIHGPGHQAVYTDVDGDVLVYHWYEDNNSSRLGINRIRYDEDWPVVF